MQDCLAYACTTRHVMREQKLYPKGTDEKTKDSGKGNNKLFNSDCISCDRKCIPDLPFCAP
jgi:hypothetical protein